MTKKKTNELTLRKFLIFEPQDLSGLDYEDNYGSIRHIDENDSDYKRVELYLNCSLYNEEDLNKAIVTLKNMLACLEK